MTFREIYLCYRHVESLGNDVGKHHNRRAQLEAWRWRYILATGIVGSLSIAALLCLVALI